MYTFSRYNHNILAHISFSLTTLVVVSNVSVLFSITIVCILCLNDGMSVANLHPCDRFVAHFQGIFSFSLFPCRCRHMLLSAVYIVAFVWFSVFASKACTFSSALFSESVYGDLSSYLFTELDFASNGFILLLNICKKPTLVV
ncbi:hypothetical protein HanPSC8_Chr14g0620301 [Helianthus annuus]|nr:hypothetical protein HanPSC8_Chr14g0620301 [Helianthus annuus]